MSLPSVKTLIRYTCLSERTVQTALNRLEADGGSAPVDTGVQRRELSHRAVLQ